MSVIDRGHNGDIRHPLSVADVARRLGVSERRVRLIPASELPYRALVAGGHRRYAPADVDAYLAGRIVRR